MAWNIANLSGLNSSNPVTQLSVINNLSGGLLGAIIPVVVFLVAFTTLRRDPNAETGSCATVSLTITLISSLPLLVLGVVTWPVYGLFVAALGLAIFWNWSKGPF